MSDLSSFLLNNSDALLNNKFNMIPVIRWTLPSRQILKIRGIRDEYFNKLNNTSVYLLKDKPVRKNRDITGEVEKDSFGNIKYTAVTVPTGSKAVLSNVNIRLPFKYKYGKGFGYIDVLDGLYAYIIPNEYLYKPPMFALALSRNKLRSYKLVHCKLMEYGWVYLTVIPYIHAKQYSATKILACKEGTTDFSNEISVLVGEWNKIGILDEVKFLEPTMFDIDMNYKCLGDLGFDLDE